MATLRSKRKLAAVTRETQDENPRNGQSRNTSVPTINEDYLTQLSEEIEGRITKKLSREFSRIESRISDALSKLDEILSNQQIQTYSETVPGKFRNTNVENQGTNEDDSQSDPHPEGGLFRSQTTQNSGPEAGHYIDKVHFLSYVSWKEMKLCQPVSKTTLTTFNHSKIQNFMTDTFNKFNANYSNLQFYLVLGMFSTRTGVIKFWKFQSGVKILNSRTSIPRVWQLINETC